MQKYSKGTNVIKAAIPYGGISEIAAASGTSIFTVSRVINGKSRNKKAMEALATYLSTLKATKETIVTSVDAISN